MGAGADHRPAGAPRTSSERAIVSRPSTAAKVNPELTGEMDMLSNSSADQKNLSNGDSLEANFGREFRY
jgi:hypothetical protein